MFHALISRQTTPALCWGIVASLGMAIFYTAIMLITMPLSTAWLNFVSSWYLISGIVIGFGVQIGLWVNLKHHASQHHHLMPGASGAMSGTAMVACCAHHLADVLPIIGLSGAAIFLGQYQQPLLVFSLAINVFGVAYMLHLQQRHKTMIKKIISTKEVKI